MRDLYDIVKFYMGQGMRLEEALEEIQSILHTQFDEHILARVKEEHNFNLYHIKKGV